MSYSSDHARCKLHGSVSAAVNMLTNMALSGISLDNTSSGRRIAVACHALLGRPSLRVCVADCMR